MKPIWFPLFISIPILLALYVAKRNWPWWSGGSDKYFDMIMPVVMACLVLIVCEMLMVGAAFGVSSVIQDHTVKVWHLHWTGKMVSMRNADGVHGEIAGGVFMIAGRIDSVQVYHYYTLKNDGSFQPHQWKANSDTSIFEEEREGGEVQQFDIHLKNEWMNWFTYPDDRLRMDFHIPKGSLKQSFSLQ
jgi:hypothetical protein